MTGSGRSNMMILGLILAAVVLVYARSLNYGPVNWDNQLIMTHIYGDGVSAGSVLDRIGLRPGGGTYQPVRDVVTMLLAAAHQDSWIAYHLVSLALYLGTVVFFYLIMVVIFGRIDERWGFASRDFAALAATGVFALHPSHAETVAWVSGQKDALLGFFYAGSLYFYIRKRAPGLRDILLSLVLYALALGSKPAAVTLPLAAMLHDMVFREGFGVLAALRRRWWLYGIYLSPALAATAYFLTTTARIDAGWSMARITVRLGKVASAFVFSGWKLVFPVNLCLRYPGFPFTGPGDPLLWLNTGLALLLLWLAVWSFRRGKPWAFFLGWAMVSLLPNANLVPIVIERADRYFYLASMGYAALAGYLAAGLAVGSGGRVVRRLVAAAVVLLGLLTFNQAGYWRDGITAWRHNVELYPELTLARIGLGHSYLRADSLNQALRIYRPMLERRTPNFEAVKGAVEISLRRNKEDQAIRLLEIGRSIAPGDEDIFNSLVSLHLKREELDKAAAEIGQWMDRYPDSYAGRQALARLRRLQGDREASIRLLEETLEKTPEDVPTLNSLAMLLFEEGEVRRAESLLDRALDTGRNIKPTLMNLARVYSSSGREQEAFEIYSRYPAGELTVRGAEFMGAEYFSRNQPDRALEYFAAMARIDPDLPRAWNNQAVVLENMGELAAADSFYRKAIALDSSYVDAFFNRGNLLRKTGRAQDALEYYERADSLAGRTDRAVLEALLGLSAELGDPVRAALYRQRLEGLASGSGRNDH